MPQHQLLPLISEAEYLEGEKRSEIKHEYVAGQVFAMSDVSRAHNRIALNLAVHLRQAAHGTTCEVYIAEVKLRIAHRQSYYYPDIQVGCERDDDDQYYLERPCLVIEVLSPNTETIDRREKLLAYQTIAGLQAYLIAAQDKMQVEVYRPQADTCRIIFTHLTQNLFRHSRPRENRGNDGIVQAVRKVRYSTSNFHLG